MKFKIEKVIGPRTSSVPREEALEQLQTHPQYPKGAIIKDFKEVNGHWVAELKVSATKQAAPPPPAFLDTEESESAPTDEAPEEEPKDESKDEPKDEKKDEKGDKVSLDSIMDLVKQIAAQVGVPTGDEEPPADELTEALGEELPPSPEEGPVDEPKKGPSDEQHGHRTPTKLKPGEVLPNQTPIGAPAFSSTQIPEDHPWKEVIGKVATFTVSEQTDAPISENRRVLAELGEPFGYKPKQMIESRDEQGNRVVRALISRYE